MSRRIWFAVFVMCCCAVSAPAQHGGGVQNPVPGGGSGLYAGQGECIRCVSSTLGGARCVAFSSVCDSGMPGCVAHPGYSYCEDYVNNPGQPSNYCGASGSCNLYYYESLGGGYDSTLGDEYQIETIATYLYLHTTDRDGLADWMAATEDRLSSEPVKCRMGSRLEAYRERFKELTGFALKPGQVPDVGASLPPRRISG